VSAVFLLLSPDTTRLFDGSLRIGAGKANTDVGPVAIEDCEGNGDALVGVRVSVGNAGVLVKKGVSVDGKPVGDGVNVRVLVGKISGDRVGVVPRTIGESEIGTAGATKRFTTVTPRMIPNKTNIKMMERNVCSTARSCSKEKSVVRARRRASVSSLMPTIIPSPHIKYIQTAYALIKATKAAKDKLQVSGYRFDVSGSSFDISLLNSNLEPETHFLFFSDLDWQEMHMVASGLASMRSDGIGLPQVSQIPYLPAAIRAST
jgi:hypothetical protein